MLVMTGCPYLRFGSERGTSDRWGGRHNAGFRVSSSRFKRIGRACSRIPYFSVAHAEGKKEQLGVDEASKDSIGVT